MASRKTTGKRQTGSTGKKTASGQKKTTRSAGRKKAEKNGFLPKEILILLAFAFSVLLFLSNLHMCGSVGTALNQVMRGLFGALSYVFPFFLFGVVLFYCANKGSFKAAVKLCASVAAFFLMCGFCQLLASGGFVAERSYLDYYEAGFSDFNGGFIGGLFCKTLVPTFGSLGTGVILLILLIICLVIISERSIVEPIGRKSNELYEYAKEDAMRRKEVHAVRTEERKKARLEKKVQGVAFNTGLKKPEEKPEKASVFTGTIQKPEQTITVHESLEKEKNTQDEYEELLRQLEPESDSFQEGKQEKEDAIVVKKDTRTLVELEAIDSLKGTLADSYAREYHPGSIKPIFSQEREEETDTLDLTKGGFFSSSPEEEEDRDFPPAKVEKEESPEELWRKEDEDTIRVMTASGKVIEAEKTESIFQRDKNPSGSSGKTFSSNSKSSDGKSSVPSVQEKKKHPPRPYVFPPVSLLKSGGKQGGGINDRALKETAIKLQKTLENFGVGVTVTNISCGPTVTRYELQPEQGVKVSKIVSLADDIKLNLAAADIRIEAPIPGKAAVGIEVPNKENQTVYFRDIMETEAFKKHPSKVAFAVGRDIGGQPVVTDLAKMPHLLIAGATGSGKSICINTLIMSILYKATPEQVKLIMIDPKVVELGIYNGIPNLMIPVVTDPKKASGALKWAVAEMTDRYKRFAYMNVRDLKGYNEKIREQKAAGEDGAELPMIVIIVDEFADLMMVAPGEVEDSVCRLAQMARAAGIHLVLATQRPSVNVITGLIKANVPSRIALSVSSGVDSRTIIDMNGAEKLLGKGDMLFYPSGYQKPVRVQGAFVSDGEIEKVVNFLKTKNEGCEYDLEIETRMNQEEERGMGAEESQRDAYFVQAGRYLIEKQKGSIGMLQRAFKIGFNRAARIMDQLSEAGVVGPEEGTKPRQVLMTMEDFEAYVQGTEGGY